MINNFGIEIKTDEGEFMKNVWDSQCVQDNIVSWARTFMMDDCAT